MPHGKPAGMPCVELLDDYRCALFGLPSRPAVCLGLRPSPSMCGADRSAALAHLGELERHPAGLRLLFQPVCDDRVKGTVHRSSSGYVTAVALSRQKQRF